MLANTQFSTLSFSQKMVYIYLFLSILLPGGVVFNINIKLIFLVLALFFIFFDKKKSYSVRFIILLLPVVLFLIIGILYSSLINSDLPSAINQSIDVFLCFVLPVFSISTFSRKNISETVFPMISNALYITALVKIIIIFYSYLRGIPPSAIVQAIAEFFNTNIMTFDVEGTYAARINFPTDLLLFVSTFYLVDILIKQGFNKKPSFQFCLILLSVVLSMSRFIWAVNLVALILAILVNVKSKKSIFVIVSFLFLSTIIVQIDSVQDIFMSRYSSSANDYSDSKREIQQKSIFREFDKAELLGNGLGSHAQLLRSFTPGKLYIYELQFQAFLMQVGIIGMFLFLMYVYFIFLIFSEKTIIKFKVITLIFLIFWIVSSFYNPSLFTSSGGAILLFILSLSCISSYRKVAFNYAENQ